MLKRTLPGLSEEETREYRHLDFVDSTWPPAITPKDRERLAYLRSQIVWVRVNNE